MARSGRLHLAGGVALLALLVAPALPGGTGARVLAHAQLVAGSPGAGEVLDASPSELRLVFSEPLEDEVTSLDLVGSDGRRVLTRAGAVDRDDRHQLVVTNPELADGIYTVTWRTLSAADGHTASGFFSFGIGDAGDVLPSSSAGHTTHTATDVPGVVGRWLTYIGLLLAVGVPLFHRAVIRRGPMPLRLVRLLGGLLLLSAAATLVVAVAAALESGSLVAHLTGTRTGLLLLARAGVAAAGGVTLLLVAPRVAGIVAGVTGLLGIVLLVVAGHAAALPGPAVIVGQAVHVAAVGVWLGGIAGLLALVARPSLILDADGRMTLRTVVPRVSALAFAAIGMVAVTGVYAAWSQTGALLAVQTEYGRTLLMKSGFAIGAFALGGLNYLDGGRMLGWLGGFRTRVSVEVMLAAVVLVMSAALAATPPDEDVRGVAIAPVPDAFGDVVPDLTLEIAPGRPGVNRALVGTGPTSTFATLELTLEGLETGTTTRVPLVPADAAAAAHGAGHEGAAGASEWVADALVLPAGSQWDGSVRALDADATELARQRFAFAMGPSGIDEGRAESPLDPET